MAEAIAERMNAALTGAEKQQMSVKLTDNAAAYDAYLRGLAFANHADAIKPNTDEAIAAFDEAVRLDPRFLAAWAWLARVHSFAYWLYDHSKIHRDNAAKALDVAAGAAYEQARAHILAALRDQPDNPDLYSNLAFAEAGLGRREEAIRQVRRAIVLLPEARDAYIGPTYEEAEVRIEARIGDGDAAIAGAKRLLGLSYGSPPLTVPILRLDPDFDRLQNDPRFKKLLAYAAH